MTEPSKLLRLAGMATRLLAELHHDDLASAARARVDAAYQDSIEELRGVLSDPLRGELDRLAAPLQPGDGPPSSSELRVAEAQLSGWLEGLIEAVQASAAIQQAEQVDQAQQATRRAPPPDAGGYR